MLLSEKAKLAEKEAKAEANAIANVPKATLDTTEPPESEVDKPESEVDKPELEVDKPELEVEKPELKFDKPESEADKPQTEAEKPEPGSDTPDPAAETHDSDEPVINVGTVTLAQESDENSINPYDDAKKKKVAEIIITKPNPPLGQGLRGPDIKTGNKKDLKDNEIQNNDIDTALNNEILGPTEINFKSLNLTMKKDLLKRGKYKHK